jgi:hypothetical protein
VLGGEPVVDGDDHDTELPGEAQVVRVEHVDRAEQEAAAVHVVDRRWCHHPVRGVDPQPDVRGAVRAGDELVADLNAGAVRLAVDGGERLGHLRAAAGDVGDIDDREHRQRGGEFGIEGVAHGFLRDDDIGSIPLIVLAGWATVIRRASAVRGRRPDERAGVWTYGPVEPTYRTKVPFVRREAGPIIRAVAPAPVRRLVPAPRPAGAPGAPRGARRRRARRRCSSAWTGRPA